MARSDGWSPGWWQTYPQGFLQNNTATYVTDSQIVRIPRGVQMCLTMLSDVAAQPGTPEWSKTACQHAYVATFTSASRRRKIACASDADSKLIKINTFIGRVNVGSLGILGTPHDELGLRVDLLQGIEQRDRPTGSGDARRHPVSRLHGPESRSKRRTIGGVLNAAPSRPSSMVSSTPHGAAARR